MTIAANPKAAVFAFSFFPQFLPRHGPVFGTTPALASVQVVLDSTYCVLVVLLASRARRWLSRVTPASRISSHASPPRKGAGGSRWVKTPAVRGMTTHGHGRCGG